MKSTRTPPDATGVTARELEIDWTPSGSSMAYSHVVPAGTRCVGLLGGQGDMHWVVEDLSWMPRSDYARFDAEHRGLPVPEDQIEVTMDEVPSAPGMR